MSFTIHIYLPIIINISSHEIPKIPYRNNTNPIRFSLGTQHYSKPINNYYKNYELGLS